MARYLLDTNICIYIAKRHPPEVLKRFESLQVGDVSMSLITYGELLFGAEKSQFSQRAWDNLLRFAELVQVLPLPSSAANYYAMIRATLEKAGTPIGANDLWIAAHALTEDLVLVTNNLREFDRVPGLNAENWVKSD
ncbi:MAG: type II toxin-antitoxin system tRNA(fMet)-specific endonuclease VapC [Methylococcales bacterium]